MANPIVSRAELAVGGAPMTVKGVIQKTSLLLGLSAITGVGRYLAIFYENVPKRTRYCHVCNIRDSSGDVRAISLRSGQGY